MVYQQNIFKMFSDDSSECSFAFRSDSDCNSVEVAGNNNVDPSALNLSDTGTCEIIFCCAINFIFVFFADVTSVYLEKNNSNMCDNKGAFVEFVADEFVNFKVIYLKQKFDLSMNLNVKIAALKQQLEELIGVPASMQKVMYRV